ncbi:D-aminoacyl-tRNA deacylase [Spiribacter sp. 1M153]|uniref:D-aminoacyl-tRNA deacylase n=1 Tax=Spiribacter TaxID=1335745 RepID=UPI00132FB8F5|nr:MULTISPECIES: D-aminoacyl-tRNA deacylase [Spiribacter]KAF0282081.1 D-tyrosyl-tRNA(Tyr) deacylase [Spiribacter roseus]KAF0285705.1 D-tyrosyl-tRNA(Tyr) deacylase [Spiribacter sp. SSL99]
MIGLLQRVVRAEVRVDDATVAAIDAGLLVLVGVEQGDTPAGGARLIERLLAYRVFADASERMNRSLTDTGGGLLLVPQFTLVADTRKGTRPGFSAAAPPATAAQRFDQLVDEARRRHPRVEAGVFGADMQVSLCNDGPVTFWLSVPPDSK